LSSMAGYTKLFNSILLSSIWGEDDATRIVWITMLAMADRNGRVEAAVPGLSHIARVPLDACAKAVKTLESPDVHSRSAEFEGRRIEKVDGGWVLLNHEKYRAKLSEDERREYFRVKKREQRQKSVQDVKDNGVDVKNVTQAEAEAQADAEATKSNTVANTAPATDRFEEFWSAYPKKVGKKEAHKAWRRIIGVHNHAHEIIAGIYRWQGSSQWDDARYIPNPATFLNGRRWEDEVPKDGTDKRNQTGAAGRQSRSIAAIKRVFGDGVAVPSAPVRGLPSSGDK
jgi:hypothetical protein